MTDIIQKRTYELVQYIQEILGDDGYESPINIFLSVDKLGWPEAKKIPLSEIIQILSDSGKYYLNDGVPYTSVQDVLDNFPIEYRTPYATVNIDGTEYQFDESMTNLTPKFEGQSIADGSLPFSKLINVAHNSVLFRVSAGNGPIEVVDLSILRDALNIPSEYKKQDIFTVLFEAGDGSVLSRCNGVITRKTGTDAWTFTAINEIDMLITHNMQSRYLVDAKVFAYFDGKWRQMINNNNALSGMYINDSNSIVIESLTTKQYPIMISFIFS